MKGAFASLARWIFKALYRVCCVCSRRDEVLFLSRQVDEPGYNFKALGDEFERRGWQVLYLTKRLSKRATVPYSLHVVREVYHLARCRVCVLDRYDPVVGLLDFDCEHAGGFDGGSAASQPLHEEFPCLPIIVQLWHAFGAFKKFGFQSLDTPEGHPTRIAQSFGIHRNYSWVVCTGEQNRKAFGEAFSYPIDRIVALALPEYDDLLQKRKAMEVARRLEDGRPFRVLFAPTLRKREASPHPFKELREVWDDSSVGADVEVVWSFHPLESGNGAALSVSKALLEADCVVTDYSSIVYEAYVLGKPVAFYVPDIESYRLSPGLNADPCELAPSIAFLDRERLASFLRDTASDRAAYPQSEFDRFVGSTFDGCEPGTAKRIADFIERHAAAFR
ncbi:CDP-glycerol glycerophosphotransferase family protein [Eggerthella timonensis]|uniref:CDP-glycerol glycerophosphotransferase family protein n=1 Tax=Eggerthella timonensis TaxID=1871008 RepID=UPI0015E0CF08|nr:CDP-glycerol glycerophosphotransferase family protein [Eggerthella timonensis]